MKKDIVWFEEVNKHDVGLVGGKGANLGEMLRAGFPVPYGFVVTSNAYFKVIRLNNLTKEIKNTIAFVNFENPKELHDAASHIQALIRNARVPKNIMLAICQYYESLVLKEEKVVHKQAPTQIDNIKKIYSNPFVAVRSSATAEDLPEASFAGQQETYLNVRGDNNLIQKVRECWASLFTERAMYYRNENGFDHLSVGLAAVVQRMIQSQRSGIAFSIDPVTNDKSTITIEAIFGLGEYIVQGKVTPDHYEISKKDFKITKKEVVNQTLAFIRRGNINIEKSLTKNFGGKQKLTDEEIIALAKIIAKIEKHYYFPQDIEWAAEENRLFIVQSRPITTIKENKPKDDSDSLKTSKQLIQKGDPASPGIAYGRPIIIKSPKELDKVKKGEILVAPQTNPDYVQAMKRASAIVTEMGGRTSHAAIVSRELGIPAIVGAENVTKLLLREKIITVNGSTGEIFKGNVMISRSPTKSSKKHKKISTNTKIYVNLAEPERAKEVAGMDVDGIGLLRAEFMVADIGIHPKEILNTNKSKSYIGTLANKLKIFAKAFYPRPVVYRATDFKTNEYRHLKGGSRYEPKEENPMLGYRGAARYIADKKSFKMELDAISNVREMGFGNLNLMIPFIRSPRELVDIRSMIDTVGLLKSSMKLWIMVEIPSVALRLEDYIKVGIDGVSIGTNDLTMLMMGSDRDNPEVAHLYSEQDPSMYWILEKIVKTARKYKITSSICGQAASDYPDLIKVLIRAGITSLSVNIDAVSRIRERVKIIEKSL